MALLQIAEPGQSPQPHQRRLAVGIDLGTTNSLVAAVRSGLSAPLADAAGRVILPSAVRYHADDVEVVFRSFLLDPSAPVQPLSAVDHLAEKYGGGRAQALEMMRQVTAVAAGVGLEYHLEESLTGQTLDAHRLLHLAKEHDLQDATASRLFAGHFTEGRSLFDHDSLTSLAVEAGLPEQDVRTTLEAGTFAADVEADLP